MAPWFRSLIMFMFDKRKEKRKETFWQIHIVYKINLHVAFDTHKACSTSSILLFPFHFSILFFPSASFLFHCCCFISAFSRKATIKYCVSFDSFAYDVTKSFQVSKTLEKRKKMKTKSKKYKKTVNIQQNQLLPQHVKRYTIYLYVYILYRFKWCWWCHIHKFAFPFLFCCIRWWW